MKVLKSANCFFALRRYGGDVLLLRCELRSGGSALYWIKYI